VGPTENSGVKDSLNSMRHPISLGNYMRCLVEFHEFLSMYKTKMCFKILKFYVGPTFFPEQTTLVRPDAAWQ
jgi:hypothetical protein